MEVYTLMFLMYTHATLLNLSLRECMYMDSVINSKIFKDQDINLEVWDIY